MRNPASLLPLLLLLILLIPRPGLAQNPLDRVEMLMGQGRIIMARDVLQEWLEGEGSSAGRMDRQRGVWLRGLLTVDPDMAALDFRRLVLEFPGGPYSDDALLRLAQRAHRFGDLPGAYAHYSALARDYPSSPYRARAVAWTRDHGEAARAAAAAASSAAASSTAASPAAATPGISTAPLPILEDDESRVVPGPGDSLSVQVGAFRNLDGARSLASVLRASGYQPRLVRVAANDLIRVRMGRFSRRQEATRLLQELVEAGFEAAVVMDAHVEEEVR